MGKPRCTIHEQVTQESERGQLEEEEAGSERGILSGKTAPKQQNTRQIVCVYPRIPLTLVFGSKEAKSHL